MRLLRRLYSATGQSVIFEGPDFTCTDHVHICFQRSNTTRFIDPEQFAHLVFLRDFFSFSLQWYVLQHLPVVDCLPYKVGNNIPEKMKIPAGAIPDSTVISFVYESNEKEVEFTADKFPEDFNDSTYRFIRRYDKLIRKGNAESSIKDFSLQTVYGNDTTQALLNEDSYQLFLFIKDGYKLRDWSEVLGMVMNEAKKKGIQGFLSHQPTLIDLTPHT